ncbi:ATP-binding protein [Streptococcus suis]
MTSNPRDINIAGRDNIIHNYYQNDKLKYFITRKDSTPLMTKFLKFYKMFINKHMLDSRFSYFDFKYEELVEAVGQFDKVEHQENNIQFFLDDGYKSIIHCIVEVFKPISEYSFNNEKLIYVGDGVKCGITLKNGNVTIFQVEDFKSYDELEVFNAYTIKLKTTIEKYLGCALKTGNFFNFSKVLIERLENERQPFETQMNLSRKFIPQLIEPLYGNDSRVGIREIIQNAIDAEVASDIDKPIEINVRDTKGDRILEVRDYGIGMSSEEIANLYLTIGISSKSEGKNFIGKYGIGSLAFSLLGREVTVTTKNDTFGIVYTFSYTTESLDDFDNKIIVEIGNEKFQTGTSVKVKLNSNLQKLNPKDLRDRLEIMRTFRFSPIELEYKHFVNKEIVFNEYLSQKPKPLLLSVDSNPSIKYSLRDNNSTQTLYYIDGVKMARLKGNLNIENTFFSTGRPEFILVESKDFPINLARDNFISRSSTDEIRKQIQTDWMKKRGSYLKTYIENLSDNFPIIIDNLLSKRVPTIQDKDFYGIYNGKLTSFPNTKKVIAFTFLSRKNLRKLQHHKRINSIIKMLSERYTVICLDWTYFQHHNNIDKDFIENKNTFFILSDLINTKNFRKLKRVSRKVSSIINLSLHSNLTENNLQEEDIKLIKEFFKIFKEFTNEMQVFCGIYDIENIEDSCFFQDVNSTVEKELLADIDVIRKK